MKTCYYCDVAADDAEATRCISENPWYPSHLWLDEDTSAKRGVCLSCGGGEFTLERTVTEERTATEYYRVVAIVENQIMVDGAGLQAQETEETALHEAFRCFCNNCHADIDVSAMEFDVQ